MGFPVSTPVLPIAERKRGVLPSSRIPAAARYSFDELLKLVVCRHLVTLAASLVQTHPRALAGEPSTPHGDDGAAEAEVTTPDQRAVPQADDG